jgi:hypothetical protein
LRYANGFCGLLTRDSSRYLPSELTLGLPPKRWRTWRAHRALLVNCFVCFAVRPINTSWLKVLRRPVESTQYASLAFGERCRLMQVRPSMGTAGDAYDNAVAGSFFASLEGGRIEGNSFQSKAQACMAIFTWIEGWYNPGLRPSGLGYLSPLNLEKSKQTMFDVVEEADVHAETTLETV